MVPVLVVDDAAEALQLDPSPHSKMPAGKRANLEPASEGPSNQINQVLSGLDAGADKARMVFSSLQESRKLAMLMGNSIFSYGA